jgi:hypothetical protein
MSMHLFPHSHCPESIIKKIVSFFGPLKVCLPWMMETPDVFKNISIEISRPPFFLKPGDFLMVMLAEYRTWAEKNHDRNYIELLKFDPANKLTDNKTWEIRKMLGHAFESHSVKEKDVIRWHLLLHLAGDIEEKRLETDKLLSALKDKKAPLDGSIEDSGDIKDLLGDLDAIGDESVLDDQNLRNIFEAWFGLFGGYLNKNASLITYNKQIMDYLDERWDGLPVVNLSTIKPVVGFDVPDLSNHTPDVQDKFQTENDIENILKEIKDLITSIGENPTHKLIALDKLSHKLDKANQKTLSKRAMRLTVRYLFPIKDTILTESDSILRHFFNHTIILVEPRRPESAALCEGG